MHPGASEATGNDFRPRRNHNLSEGSARLTGMSTTCQECGVEHEHCHGTVILHIGRRPECTEADCITPEALHGYTIDCFAVGCECADWLADQPIGPAVSAVSSSSASG